ncbi:MAG: response regulator [Deltaproteobacteria bacterium]|nr:response regulator [Deltaproteobacteria bacterium]
MERRDSKRYNLILKADITYQDRKITEYIEDISIGGCFIATSLDLPLAEKIGIELSFPSIVETLSLEGVVVWKRTPMIRKNIRGGVGVRFEIAPQVRKRLEQFLLPLMEEKGGLPPVDRPFRVIIAEDNPHILGMYRYGIQRLAKYELPSDKMILVSEVTEAKDVDEIIFREEFDLLILDFYIPMFSGDEVIKRLRSSGVEKPILVISGGGEEGREKALAAGADMYLDKPITVNDLIANIKRLLFIDFLNKG